MIELIFSFTYFNLIRFLFYWPYLNTMQKSKSLAHRQYSSLVISSKVSSFREKFNQSQQKFNEKYTRDISSPKKLSSIKTTSMSQLMTTPTKIRPSSGKNNDSTTKKQILNIMIESSQLNPERKFTLVDMKASILLTELDGKAKEMSGYSEENAVLLKRKSNLEDKIGNLKRAIAEQRKRLSEAQVSCGSLTNNISLSQQRWVQKNMQVRQLDQRIQQTSWEIRQLKKSISQNTSQSNYNQKHITQLQKQISELSLTVTNTNISYMKQNQKRLQTKQRLTLELKVMENDAILYRELVGQQNNLSKEIEKAFNENKMDGGKEGGKEGGRLKLLIQSNKK